MTARTTFLLVMFLLPMTFVYAQSSGMTCYKIGTTERVPCPTDQRPAPPRQPPVQPTQPGSSAEDAARRNAAARAERERAEREEAERQERERRIAEEERLRKLNDDKQEINERLKGSSAAGSGLKGASSDQSELKSGGSVNPQVAPPKAAAWDTSDPLGLEFDRSKIRSLESLNKTDWNRLDLYQAEREERDYRTLDAAAVSDTWDDIRKRTGVFGAPAVREGRALSRQSFGKQQANDCSLQAIANATGTPYFLVKERAEIVLKRLRPGPTIDEILKNGLKSMEIAVIAESIGQIKAVDLDDFGKTIASGRPLVVGVAIPNRTGDRLGGHEVVLDRTFKLNGEQWFEMVDSNQGGSWDRRFVSSTELRTILLEKGMVIAPEPPPSQKTRVHKK